MVDLDADAHQYRLDEIEELKSEIKRLSECLKEANKKIEHFEREWDLAVDCVEALEAAQGRLVAALRVNMMRLSSASHEDIDALIRAALAGEKKV